MATMQAIKMEMEKLTIYYRDSRSDADLFILKKMWFEDLKQISDQDLSEACRIARVQSPNFMPTPGKILDAHRENMESKARNRKALPEPIHGPIDINEMREIRKKNMGKLKSISESIGKKIAYRGRELAN